MCPLEERFLGMKKWNEQNLRDFEPEMNKNHPDLRQSVLWIEVQDLSILCTQIIKKK